MPDDRLDHPQSAPPIAVDVLHKDRSVDDLTAAFGLLAGDRVAIVGGGGKTTIMYRLAREAVARGRRAVVGGTTRFTPPRHGRPPPAILLELSADPLAPVREALSTHAAVVVTAGRGDKGRWLALTPEQIDALVAAGIADLLAVEADGSRNRPFKAPSDAEPVIPARTSVVLAVVGLDVLGRPLDADYVHRPERVAQLAGVPLGSRVTPAVVATVLLHPEGGRKGVPPGARWIPVLNKAEPDRRAGGEAIAALLLAGGAARVILTTAEADRPVVAVLRS